MRVWARTWTSNVRDEIEDLDTDLMRVYKLLKPLYPMARYVVGILVVATALAGCSAPDPPDAGVQIS